MESLESEGGDGIGSSDVIVDGKEVLNLEGLPLVESLRSEVGTEIGSSVGMSDGNED